MILIAVNVLMMCALNATVKKVIEMDDSSVHPAYIIGIVFLIVLFYTSLTIGWQNRIQWLQTIAQEEK